MQRKKILLLAQSRALHVAVTRNRARRAVHLSEHVAIVGECCENAYRKYMEKKKEKTQSKVFRNTPIVNYRLCIYTNCCSHTCTFLTARKIAGRYALVRWKRLYSKRVLHVRVKDFSLATIDYEILRNKNRIIGISNSLIIYSRNLQ